MDLLSKYLVPAYQAPDGAAAATQDPPGASPDPATPDPAATPEPLRPAVPEAVIHTITGLRGKTRELEAENERLRKEAADAQALATRLSKGDGTGTTPPAPAVTPPVPTSDDQAVEQRANYKLFLRDVDTMRQAGFKQFGTQQFGGVIRALDSVGAADDAFVSQVITVDPANAHVLLNEIAQDLEKAVSLVNMDPARRISELTRMSMAAAAPKTAEPPPTPPTSPTTPPARDATGKFAKGAPAPATTLSKAPPPAPPVEPSASKTLDWRSDDASDEEFSKGWDNMMTQRAKSRRGTI